MKTLADEWKVFESLFPKGVSRIQLNETRRAFYAGAWTIYWLIMNSLSEGEEVEPSDLDLMASLHDEMIEFRNAVQRGEK